MRSELRRIESDACHPLLHETRVLSCRQSAFVAPTGKEKLTGLPAGQPQVVVDCQSRLVRQLEPHGPAGLLLPDGRAVHGVAARRHIVDADGDHIAAAQLAVDRKVEEGEIRESALLVDCGNRAAKDAVDQIEVSLRFSRASRS